jgi:hypothetical protein
MRVLRAAMSPHRSGRRQIPPPRLTLQNPQPNRVKIGHPTSDITPIGIPKLLHFCPSHRCSNWPSTPGFGHYWLIAMPCAAHSRCHRSMNCYNRRHRCIRRCISCGPIIHFTHRGRPAAPSPTGHQLIRWYRRRLERRSRVAQCLSRMMHISNGVATPASSGSVAAERRGPWRLPAISSGARSRSVICWLTE